MIPGRAAGLTSGVPVGTDSAVPVALIELIVPTVSTLSVAADPVPGTVVKTVTVGVPVVGMARVTGPGVAGLLETGALVTGVLVTEALVTGALRTGALVAGVVAGRAGFAVVAGRAVVRTGGFAVVVTSGFVVVLAVVGAAALTCRSPRRR